MRSHQLLLILFFASAVSARARIRRNIGENAIDLLADSTNVANHEVSKRHINGVEFVKHLVQSPFMIIRSILLWIQKFLLPLMELANRWILRIPLLGIFQKPFLLFIHLLNNMLNNIIKLL